MKIKKDFELTKAVFITECKNRFVGECNINGIHNNVYIPSSVRLKHFVDLKDNEVLLTKTKNKNCKYKYKLFAYKNNWDCNYTIVDLSFLNIIIGSFLKDEFTTLKAERKIDDDYKIDFYDDKTQTGIEVKAILLDRNVSYPTNSTNRSIKQLKSIESLLGTGINFIYCFVSNKSPRLIEINKADEQFYKLFFQAVSKGMIVRKYYVILKSEMNISVELYEEKNKDSIHFDNNYI